MKPLILMYHRIADEPIDYWGLAVSPPYFEEHLLVLRRARRALPLAEFVHDFIAGTLPQDAVALTFDDGYVDNLLAGLPRLAAADVPATVFLATGYLDRIEPFWWDELARFILREHAPDRFEVVIRGQTMAFDLADEPSANQDDTAPVAPLNARHAVLEAIYQPLRRLDDEERRAVMIELRSILGAPDCGTSLGRPMTSGEVRMLASAGPVSIGAHTVTHPILSELETAARDREVTASKRACEALIGAPVAAFAYPFGEFDAGTRETVKSAGFAFACSTKRGPVVTTSDVFALPRIYVPNLDGDAFEQRIRSASTAG